MAGVAKPRIISIMPHGPAYHYLPGKLPDIHWKKPDGGVVGFWPREWLDILGEAVLKETDKYDWEVWQPDFLADQVYSKTLESGVVHRLFPTVEKSYGSWPLSRKGLCSEAIISRLKELEGEPIIVMLYGTYGFRLPFYLEILRAFGPAKKFPVFMRSGGMFMTPLSEIPALHRPLTYLSLLSEHFELKRLFRYVDVISEQSATALGEVRSIYKGRVEKLTMGCDFSFWSPVPSEREKISARKKLGVGPGKKVFFASGNFVPRKQLDKLIEVFLSLRERVDFFLVIAGQGSQDYTEKLSGQAAPLVGQGKALLHPYATGEELRGIYWASDIYVSVATDEGGPASVMKAMACGLPILSTPVGETTDRMMKHGVGNFIPVKNYKKWTETIVEILSGCLPVPLDLKIAREAYDWTNVAKRFIRIYDDLIASRY